MRGEGKTPKSAERERVADCVSRGRGVTVREGKGERV